MSEEVKDDEYHDNSGACPPPEVLEGSHVPLTSKQLGKVKSGEGEV